jgi:hypothetical protein
MSYYGDGAAEASVITSAYNKKAWVGTCSGASSQTNHDHEWQVASRQALDYAAIAALLDK